MAPCGFGPHRVFQWETDRTKIVLGMMGDDEECVPVVENMCLSEH